ncbi:hypothetical protein EWM64_g4216, partial [Hericium alpestre]
MPSGTSSTSFTFHAATLARVHNILSFTAFASALAIGCALHYKKIVKNGVAGWPQEWFPSVSATIGDWYPERNIFQIFIALNSAFLLTSTSVRAEASYVGVKHTHLDLRACKKAYQSWTLLTALPTTLFYFSVWKLALTGSELSTLATLSPVFLASSTVRSFVHSNLGCQLLVLIGAASGIGTWRAESVLTRLIGVAVGVMASVLKWAGEWEAGGEATGYHSTVFLLGLIVSSLTKHFNHGNNPGWPIVDEHSGGHQKYILAIASLSLLELMTRPSTSLSSTSALEPSTPSKAKYDKVAQPKQSSSGHWLPPALALGALVFSLHERLTDASTLIAWSWTGYPLKGPAPRLHAPFTLLAQALGVLLALHSSSTHSHSGTWLAHPLWHCIGAVSAYVLYAHRDWPGYIGGLANAVFLMSTAPHVIENAGAAARAHGAARVFTTAWLVWVIMLFTSTFTVAYAFVPGAWSFREHTDWILSAQVLVLGLAFDWRSILPGSLGR